MTNSYIKQAEEICNVYQTGPYIVLRLRFLHEEFSDELDNDGDPIPYGGYSTYEFVVVDEHKNLVDFIEAESVLAEYWNIIEQRMDEYEKQHPEWLFGYPDQLYFIREDASA